MSGRSEDLVPMSPSSSTPTVIAAIVIPWERVCSLAMNLDNQTTKTANSPAPTASAIIMNMGSCASIMVSSSGRDRLHGPIGRSDPAPRELNGERNRNGQHHAPRLREPPKLVQDKCP